MEASPLRTEKNSVDAVADKSKSSDSDSPSSVVCYSASNESEGITSTREMKCDNPANGTGPKYTENVAKEIMLRGKYLLKSLYMSEGIAAKGIGNLMVAKLQFAKAKQVALDDCPEFGWWLENNKSSWEKRFRGQQHVSEIPSPDWISDYTNSLLCFKKCDIPSAVGYLDIMKLNGKNFLPGDYLRVLYDSVISGEKTVEYVQNRRETLMKMMPYRANYDQTFEELIVNEYPDIKVVKKRVSFVFPSQGKTLVHGCVEWS